MTILSIALLMALCGDDAPQANPKSPKRLSMETASAKVTDYIRRKSPNSQIDGSLAAVDLTTDAAWDQLNAQVVQIKDENIERNETFVLSGDRVTHIGHAFGGDGVTSIVVADLVGDKWPLLIYSFDFGSGIHRSEIGILDLHGEQPKEVRLMPINFSEIDDYSLRGADTGVVEVLIGKTLIGHVTAERKEGTLAAAIKLAEQLPEDVRRNLR